MRNVLLIWILLIGVTLARVARSSAPPNGPASNKPDPALTALGHKLFLDKRLSQDGSVSCSNCHEPTHAFSDGRTVSIGVSKRVGTRNTPSLLNVFDGEPLFWDGRRSQLDVAVLDPLTNHVEMGNSNLVEVTRRLAADPSYRFVFKVVFHDSAASLSETQLGMALATYVRSLSRSPSAYDRFEKGQIDALSPQAREGLRLFTGKAECAGCHDPARGRFTDGKFHHTGVGFGDVAADLGELTAQAFRRDVLPAEIGSAVGQNPKLSALGRFMVSRQASDVGAFRTPSLRDVAVTAPYMHDGSIQTLEAAVDAEIYYRGLSTGHPINLTVNERNDLMAFLRNLTSTDIEPLTTSGSRGK